LNKIHFRIIVILIFVFNLTLNAEAKNKVNKKDFTVKNQFSLYNFNDFRLAFEKYYTEENGRLRFSYERSGIHTKENHYKNNSLNSDFGQDLINLNDRVILYGMLGTGFNFSEPFFINCRAILGSELIIFDKVSLVTEKLFQFEYASDKIRDYNDFWIGIKVNFANTKEIYYKTRYDRILDKYPNWSQEIVKLVADYEIYEDLYKEHSDWDIEVLKAVTDNRFIEGMTERQVLEAYGEPDIVIDMDVYKFMTYKDWNYFGKDYDYELYFQDGKLKKYEKD
jgi:hypothetical protein